MTDHWQTSEKDTAVIPKPNSISRVLHIAATTCIFAAVLNSVRADIYQWEYIDPTNPALGKRQSTTLCPDGAGVDAVPGADLYARNLTMAYLIGANLAGAHAAGANLTIADLSGANLTDADFFAANLTDASFDGAVVQGTKFVKSEGNWIVGTGITLAQLYSTASYQAHDLSRIDLTRNDLSDGHFAGQNLAQANLGGADLTGANFRQANLTIAKFNTYVCNFSCSVEIATLTDADFTDADVRGADFAETGITLGQLYSTTSFRSHNLTGIILRGNDLRGGNFSDQDLSNVDFGRAGLTGANFAGANLGDTHWDEADLTNASFAGLNLANVNFVSADLTGADFSGAQIRDARFGRLVSLGNCIPGVSGCFPFVVGSGVTRDQLYTTASYRAGDLRGIDLMLNDMTGGNFAGQVLTNASFRGAMLTGAGFTDAEVRGASFAKFSVVNVYGNHFSFGTGITPEQLYSTASYRTSDLRGIDLSGSSLVGVNLTGQNLTNTNFAGAALSGADLTAADARGAFLDPSLAITDNLIRPDGHIQGLDLGHGGLLVVRDYDGNPTHVPIPPIPITVDQHLAMDAGSTLRIVFEADEWDSTISFTPGIPVTLGGTLELTFADDVDLASQVGRTFDLFDWTGVDPLGAFLVSSPFSWDLSNLYTTGDVTLTAVPEPTTAGLIFVGILGLLRQGYRAAPTRPGGRTSCLAILESRSQPCKPF